VKRLIFLAPVLIFAVLAVLFYAGLNGSPPNALPSPLVGQAAPGLGLPPLDAQAEGFTRDELGKGKPIIINFWASWCAPCRVEHPTLQALAAAGNVPLYGIDYQDDPAAARKFLTDLGNPFGKKIDMDREGRVSIDWGVTGVPETFVVDGEGVIRAHYAGPLTDEVLAKVIMPAMNAGSTPKQAAN
jgi:cytochrome c biogenesis protein CcmG, thiol:disulfide interchange protein DsbE